MPEIATWNVLHRVHAENWGEAPARRFPDEAVRIAAIASRVATLHDAGLEVIALQEVSGDQLEAVRAALPATATVVAFRYPRVPLPRPGATHAHALADAGEHLVTVVAGPARVREAGAFADDEGKGFQVLTVDGDWTVINTHVTYGERGPGQMARLAALARDCPGPVIVVGDFNAPRAVVGSALGDDFAFVIPVEPSLPTRPRALGATKAQAIDHAIVLRAAPAGGVVLDAAGLSDHNLVTARVIALA